MEIKQRVVRTILALSKNEAYRYGEALELLQQLDPGNSLLSEADSPKNRKRLILFLGNRLKQNDFTVYHPSSASHPVLDTGSSSKRKDTVEADTLPDHEEMSTELRLNKDISRMLRGVNALATRMTQSVSDRERKQLWKDASKLQDQITYNKKLLRQLANGEKVTQKNAYFEREDEDIFEVPDDILKRQSKYQYLMSRRSKRKTKVDRIESTFGQDSMEHQEAVKEWKRFDDAVKHIKSKLP